MKFTLIFCLLFCLPLSLCAANPTKPSLPQSRLLGTWVPIAKDRSGLKRIEIARSGKSWTVHVWAYATFTQIDWGKTSLNLFGSDVESRVFDHGLAVWKPEFATKYMTLYMKNNRLAVEMFMIFTDNSGRSNYRSVEQFKRSR